MTTDGQPRWSGAELPWVPMAQQTKKRRRTKHRGNAAGVVEVRGRTGRKPRDDERAPSQSGREGRLDRLAQPPSWRSAVVRAALGALLLFVLAIFLFNQSVGQAAALTPLLFAIYVPLGYYTDRWIYRRRQRGKGRVA